MPSIKINKNNPGGSFFLTLTVKNWFYVFDRHNRWEIIADSLEFCRKNKNLKIFSFVFMLNHIHLIVMSDDMISFVKSFKTFTSKEIHKNIIKNEPSVEKLFIDDKNVFSIWKSNNMPKIIESEKFLFQKMEYIHNNPVRKRYVNKPEDWYWSSANLCCKLKIDSLWEN